MSPCRGPAAHRLVRRIEDRHLGAFRQVVRIGSTDLVGDLGAIRQPGEGGTRLPLVLARPDAERAILGLQLPIVILQRRDVGVEPLEVIDTSSASAPTISRVRSTSSEARVT